MIKKPNDFPIKLGAYNGGIYFYDDDNAWRLYVKVNGGQYVIYNMPSMRLHIANVDGGVDAINKVSQALNENNAIIKEAYLKRINEENAEELYAWA